MKFSVNNQKEVVLCFCFFCLFSHICVATAQEDMGFHSFPYDMKINCKVAKFPAWPTQFIIVNAVQSSHGPV